MEEAHFNIHDVDFSVFPLTMQNDRSKEHEASYEVRLKATDDYAMFAKRDIFVNEVILLSDPISVLGHKRIASQMAIGAWATMLVDSFRKQIQVLNNPLRDTFASILNLYPRY